jgi:hypothetical protein
MNNTPERLMELDVQHCELLDRLALLDQQISEVLLEWTSAKEVRHDVAFLPVNCKPS